jgi:hypothetical protein
MFGVPRQGRRTRVSLMAPRLSRVETTRLDGSDLGCKCCDTPSRAFCGFGSGQGECKPTPRVERFLTK